MINGEDQQDFLQNWKKKKLTAIAPTYPTYQWRTPVIAAIRILKGEPVTGPTWKLPQPAITAETLDKFVNDKMPPLHYALCGCEQMANSGSLGWQVTTTSGACMRQAPAFALTAAIAA